MFSLGEAVAIKYEIFQNMSNSNKIVNKYHQLHKIPSNCLD